MCLPVFCISRQASALVAVAFFAFLLTAASFLAFVLVATASFLAFVLVATTTFLPLGLIDTLVATAVAALFAFVLVVGHCLSPLGENRRLPVRGIWGNRGNHCVISRHVFVYAINQSW